MTERLATHTQRYHDSSKTNHQDKKVGGGPILRNFYPFPKILGITLLLISLWNYSAQKSFEFLVPEKTLLSPLDSKEIKPVNPKENLSWILIGRTDEAEAPILCPPDSKSRFTGKDPDAGKAGGEGDDREWGGWIASPTWWTWIWASSRSWWWTGKPGMLHPWGGKVRHDWVTELNYRLSK